MHFYNHLNAIERDHPQTIQGGNNIIFTHLSKSIKYNTKIGVKTFPLKPNTITHFYRKKGSKKGRNNNKWKKINHSDLFNYLLCCAFRKSI